MCAAWHPWAFPPSVFLERPAGLCRRVDPMSLSWLLLVPSSLTLSIYLPELQDGVRHDPDPTLDTPLGRRQTDRRWDRWTRSKSLEDGACRLRPCAPLCPRMLIGSWAPERGLVAQMAIVPVACLPSVPAHPLPGPHLPWPRQPLPCPLAGLRWLSPWQPCSFNPGIMKPMCFSFP